MNMPVVIEQQNGTFTASVLGAPAVRAVAETRESAVAALRGTIQSKFESGDLVMLNFEPKSLLTLAGKYKDEAQWKEMWDDIVREAYRYRDELKAREFPE